MLLTLLVANTRSSLLVAVSEDADVVNLLEYDIHGAPHEPPPADGDPEPFPALPPLDFIKGKPSMSFSEAMNEKGYDALLFASPYRAPRR